jgi:hypothetical protein
MSKKLQSCFVIPSSFVIRHSSFVIRHSWFVIRLSSIVVSELPKTATGKVQKYVLRGKPAISKQ